MFAFKEPSENLKSGCSKGVIQRFQQCGAETKTKYETFVGPQFSDFVLKYTHAHQKDVDLLVLWDPTVDHEINGITKPQHDMML